MTAPVRPMLTIETVLGDERRPSEVDALAVGRLRKLLEINRLIVGTMDGDALLDLIVAEATALVDADGCALLLRDPDGRCRIASARGVDAGLAAGFQAALDEQLDAALADLFGEPPAVLLAVPVLTHTAIEGVLVAGWRPPRQPRADDELLLSALADQSAIALANAASYQRLYRAEREAREVAERAVRSRSELLAMVSHDLRNPLGTIMMSARLLVDDLASAPDTVRKHPERIQRSVQRMLRLVEDLLDVASIETGTFSIERIAQDAALLARDALDACQPGARDRQITIGFAGPAEELRVACDRARIHQVLVNLIDNAIKFTPRGGSIQIGVERRGGEAVFAVTDTGPGIAPDHLARVFERRWQADSTSRQGSGLGLFIAWSLIDAHGGRLWVESELGVGSTFAFALEAVA